MAGAGVLLAVIGIVYSIMRCGGGISCPIHSITGLLCPGCGNTRAALALLRLDVAASLRYNILFPLEIFYIGWVLLHCCRSYLRSGRFFYRAPCMWLDVAILIVVVAWGILRNLL